MTIEEAIALDSGRSPRPGSVGAYWPDWCEVGLLETKSGKLTAVDFGVMSGVDGVSVEVPPGTYRVQIKIINFDGCLGNGRVRVFLDSIEKLDLGLELESVSVDMAQVAIGDLVDAATGLTEADWDALVPACKNCVDVIGGIATLKLATKTVRLACIVSGFGDGTYPVMTLTDNGSPVGLEIEFIQDGYMFRE